MTKKKVQFYLKKTFKILAWIIGSVVGLLLLVIILLQIPAVQNFAKDKAVAYLEDKIKTRVELETIEIGFPKKVILTGFYFEDQKNDTLLAGKKLSIDISLFKLLDNEVEINSVSLKGITANISRNKDSVFNFQYIIDAFASKEPKTDSEPMKISVGKIDLDNIRFRLDDAISKNHVKLGINHFDSKFNKFDLDAMDFDIPKINLDGLKLTLDQGLVEDIAEASVKVADTVSKRPDFKLKLGTIALSKIEVGYDNRGSSLITGISLGKLLLEFDEFDMNKQLISLDKFELKDVYANLAVGNEEKNIKTPDADTTSVKKDGWNLKLEQIDIANVNFKFDDKNSPAAKKGIDYKHLDLRDFQLAAKKLNYADNNISGNIDSLAVTEKSGLDIQSLKTNFRYTDKGATLKNLYLKTPQTLLRDEILVSYPSLEAAKNDPGAIAFAADINESHIGFKDILLFAPQLGSDNPFKSNPNAVILLDTKLSGQVKDIRFPNFTISGIGGTSLAASGRITGLPDAEKAYFDVDIKNFRTTAKDVYGFVPKGKFPSNISLPSVLALAGKVKGSLNNFKTNLNLVSSYGNADVVADFDRRIKDREKYDADISLDNFAIGQLIKNDSLGKITVKAKVKGTGLNPKTANAIADILVSKAQFNGYTYRNLALKGNIRNGKFDIDSNMKDPNLTFDLTADGGFGGKYPAVNLKLNLDIADLQKLNLHAGPMKLRGNVYADVPTADPDYLNGEIAIHHLQILQDKDPILLDSIKITAVSTADMNSIKVKSQFLKADINGKYKLTQLASALQNSIARYYDTAPASKKQKTDPQLVEFDVTVDNDPVIFDLFPQITGLEPINIKGRYNSVNDTIVLDASIPRLVYGANTISGASIKIDTKDDALVYSAAIDEIQNAQFLLPYTTISGDVKENVVNYRLQIRDKGKKEQYALAGTMKSIDGDTEIRLSPEGLKLNYEDWTISADNLLRFGKNGIYADNFELSREGNSLKLQSLGSTNAPLQVDFTNFDLKTLTNMVKKDELSIGGILDGNVLLRDLMGSVTFTSDLNITDFSFGEQPVGDIAIKVNNQTAGRLTADVDLTGNGNQVSIDGYYQPETKGLNLDLDMQHLDVKSVQGFTFGNLKDGDGFLSGKFKIAGSVDKPSVNGELNFNDVAFRVTQLNSFFKNINEKITIDNQGLTFDRFTVFDEKNNELIVSGKVLTSDYKNFGFNLTVDSDNFRAVNSKPKDNDLYYGDLFLDTKLKVQGTLENPVVRGNIKVNEDTKFTVVLPQSDPGIADREGIVEFVDEDNVMLQQTEKMQNELDQSGLKGMDISVTIQIVKEALLSLVIDKGNGDYLNLKGEADLTGGIDPSGKTTLTGKYEFTDGAYEMTFNFLKRKFEIKEGSYIIWNGEPTSANVDITAVYKVDAAPIDLLDDQLAGLSPTQRNTYKQRLPFEALLKMNGELLKPTISFDVQLPDGNYNVSSEIVSTTQTKLEQIRQDPNEMNKQVFALLLLNRFIGENPFASESGTGAEGLARQSVSKILSQQLNNLAADLVKGVELNFDLESTEDYTSGVKENRTDLNVGVSKRLLNDRLKVTVGSSFGVEGQQQPNQQANNIAGNLSADYQLTKDGRYMIRAYRKNQYEVALQGQVIETGIAFIITMDYNKFRELFHRTEEEKEMKAKMRERKKAEKERKEREAAEQKKKDEELKPVQNEK